MRKSFPLGIILLILGFLGFRCNNSSNPPNNTTDQLQNQISALQDSIQVIKDEYKPGLGELMLGIQVHHAKLWFAGSLSNWALANFELGEIREVVHTAQAIETDRPEIKSIPMIFAPLDSIDLAIQSKNVPEFKKSFILLTNTCNTCHRDNKFGFNVIQIPTQVPVFNQEFFPVHQLGSK
ncbi:MAG: hypothetical protein ACYCOO_03945 [Chitinophagaceae bacterium]